MFLDLIKLVALPVAVGGALVGADVSALSVVETNITKCSQLIADDISNESANTLSSVDEGDL